MEYASIFAKSKGGRAAAFWPAVMLTCCVLVFLLFYMATDRGLAWAVSVDAIAHASPFALLVVGAIITWLLTISLLAIITGVPAFDFGIVGVSALAAFIIFAGSSLILSAMGRHPPGIITKVVHLQQVLDRAADEDPVAKILRQHLDEPTYPGAAKAIEIFDNSLRGTQMQRAAVAARIIGIDDAPEFVFANQRGWMTASEFAGVGGKAIALLRDESQGKSIAWQSAAMSLVDRQALSSPLAIQVSGMRDE